MAPIIDKFTKWAASRPAWVGNAFHQLVAEGRSPARAKKLTVLVEGATGSEFIPVSGTKRAKWFLPNAPGAAPISRYVRELKLHGISPQRLADERKLAASLGQEPLNEYLSAAIRERAGKIRETRRKFREQLELPQYGGKTFASGKTFGTLGSGRRIPWYSNPYVNNAGLATSNNFSGKSLAIMHHWRDAVEHALATGNGSGLRKFKRIIVTHEGTPIFVSTNLKQIQKALENDRVRAKFNADKNYRHITQIAA